MVWVRISRLVGPRSFLRCRCRRLPTYSRAVWASSPRSLLAFLPPWAPPPSSDLHSGARLGSDLSLLQVRAVAASPVVFVEFADVVDCCNPAADCWYSGPDHGSAGSDSAEVDSHNFAGSFAGEGNSAV